MPHGHAGCGKPVPGALLGSHTKHVKHAWALISVELYATQGILSGPWYGGILEVCLMLPSYAEISVLARAFVHHQWTKWQRGV